MHLEREKCLKNSYYCQILIRSVTVVIFVSNLTPDYLFFRSGAYVERSYLNVSKTNACFVLMVIAYIVFGGSQKSRLFVVSNVLLLSFFSVG